MELYLPQEENAYLFLQIPISFDENTYTDIFALKNNKTLSETLSHKRYVKFLPEITEKYSECLSQPLGEFLITLKENGDEFYKKFLNKSGDESYSSFKITDLELANLKGIYAYYIDKDLKYIGRCRDSMKKRINSGYGRITPKNCYIDGQSTNCHLNSLIAKTKSTVTLWFHKMECDINIASSEQLLIKEYNPPWNRKNG